MATICKNALAEIQSNNMRSDKLENCFDHKTKTTLPN